MQIDNNREQRAKVTQMLKVRMVQNALSHFDSVPARVGATLQMNGFFRSDSTSNLTDHLIEVILNSAHNDRVATIPGPYIFYKESNEAGQFSLRVADLFLDAERSIREAAYLHFQESTWEASVISGNALEILRNNYQSLVSADAAVWRPAGAASYDAITRDFLCNLAGLRQSVTMAYDDGVNQHTLEILRPSLQTLEQMRPSTLVPIQDVERLRKILADIAEKPDWNEVFESYYSQLGHLPLGGEYSLGRVVTNWNSSHEADTEKLWESALGWAEGKSCVMARYLACTIFIENPSLIPVEKVPTLLDMVLEVCELHIDEDQAHPRSAWKFRRDLASHYVHYIESRFPEGQGEPIAVIAWWLANQVANMLADDEEFREFFWKERLLGELEFSKFAWKAVNPQILTSPLSRVTHFESTPWAMSILTQLGAKKSVFLNENTDPLVLERVQTALTRFLLAGIPVEDSTIANVTYGFEGPALESICAIAEVGERSERSAFNKMLCSIYSKHRDETQFGETLRNISAEGELEQILIATSAKLMVAEGRLNPNVIWDSLSNRDWQRAAFKILSPRVVELLFEAFASAQLKGDGKWESQLPHIYAAACEDAEPGSERMQLLFVLTLFSAMSSCSVSAVERLVKSNIHPYLNDLIKQWRQILSDRISVCPGWAGGRMRAVLAVLY